MRSKSVLIINQYAGTPAIGMEYRTLEFAKRLARDYGYRCAVIAGSFSHLRKEVIFEGPFAEECIDNVNFHWIKTPVYYSNGVRRLINIFHFIVGVLRYSSRLKSDDYELIMLSSTHPLDVIIYIYLRYFLRWKSKLIFELHDIWPLTLIELHGMSRCNPFIVICSLAENLIYRCSSAVVSILPNSRDYIIRKNPKVRLSYVPNGVNVSEWLESPLQSEQSEILDNLSRAGKIIIGYAGYHGAANAIEPALQAFSGIKSEKLVFVLFGDGPLKKRLVEMYGFDTRIYFFSRVDRKYMPSLMSRFHFGYLGTPGSNLYRFGISPNKMAEYLVSSVPLLVANSISMNEVEQYRIGVKCDISVDGDLARAFERISQYSFDEIARMKINAKKYGLENYSIDVLVKRMDVFFEEVIYED